VLGARFAEGAPDVEAGTKRVTEGIYDFQQGIEIASIIEIAHKLNL
jgi:hypothetical protein